MKMLLLPVAVLFGIYIVYRCYYSLNLDGQLDEKLRGGALILDVRTRGEWDGGHIDGALNMALSKLHDAAIPIDTNAEIITCCSHGLRSVKAVTILRKRGYRRVFNGGAWSDLQERILRTRRR